jgi:hypothetical protein
VIMISVLVRAVGRSGGFARRFGRMPGKVGELSTCLKYRIAALDDWEQPAMAGRRVLGG